MEMTTKISKLEDTLKVQAQLFGLAPELAKGKVFTCKIEPFRKERSLNANAYFHLLVDKIAKKQNLGTDEVKVKMVLEYGTIARDIQGDKVGIKLPVSVDVNQIYPYAKWFDKRPENGKEFNCYIVYKQTHLYDSAEMATLINGVVAECESLEIETKTPNEIASMISLWGRK